MSASQLAALVAHEQQLFIQAHPHSQALAQQSAQHFSHGVPMHWMRDWGTPFPLFVQRAAGAQLTCVDGLVYDDYCLGDTGALWGHAPPAVVTAVTRQVAQGLTTMLPSPLAPAVGKALQDVFGLPWWQMTQTATDANRAALRHARAITGRPRVLVFNHCYHGTVDETLVVQGADGSTQPRPGQIGAISDVAATTRVVEFNDLPAVAVALAAGDIACVLAEPALTNAGMVLPEAGFLQALRELCTQHGSLLIIDETHTLSSGLGGYARSTGLQADILVCGKAVAGGLPCAVYGYTDAVAAGMRRVDAAREPGHSGLGTTLSGNPLALAALHATLTQLMTPAHYAHMLGLAQRLAHGIDTAFAQRGLLWQSTRLGARLEFAPAPAPRNGTQSLAALHDQPIAALHLMLLNRGCLLTPFHNMMLVSPATTEAQMQHFLTVLGQCLDALHFALRPA